MRAEARHHVDCLRILAHIRHASHQRAFYRRTCNHRKILGRARAGSDEFDTVAPVLRLPEDKRGLRVQAADEDDIDTRLLHFRHERRIIGFAGSEGRVESHGNAALA